MVVNGNRDGDQGVDTAEGSGQKPYQEEDLDQQIGKKLSLLSCWINDIIFWLAKIWGNRAILGLEWMDVDICTKNKLDENRHISYFACQKA